MKAQDYTTMGLPYDANFRIGKGSSYSAGFSPDGSKLFVDTRTGIWVYDGKSHEIQSLIETSMDSYANNSRRPVISPSSENIAYGARFSFSNYTIKIVRLDNSQELQILEGHTFPSLGKVFSLDGNNFVSFSSKSIRVWEVATGREIAVFHNDMPSTTFKAISLSTSGKTIASVNSKGFIQLWDIFNSTQTLSFKPYDTEVISAVFSPDGKKIALAGTNKTIRLWDLETETELGTIKGSSKN